MFSPSPITAECLAKTLPPTVSCERVGLVTVRVTVPLFVWTELLTHRRFSRNAASARALSLSSLTAMGYYQPDRWFRSAKGMSLGEEIADPQMVDDLVYYWQQYHEVMLYYIDGIAKTTSLAKEQLNRLLSTTRMVVGIVTGTMSAWQAFFSLRLHETADYAMRQAAQRMKEAIEQTAWARQTTHVPFACETIEEAIARIARVSYNADIADPEKNKALYQRLLQHRHLSPFEHVASWKEHPAMSNYTSVADDVIIKTERSKKQWWRCDYYGWHQYRKEVE